MGRSGPIRALLVGRPDCWRSASGGVLVPSDRGSPAQSGSGWAAGGQSLPGHATESLLSPVRLILGRLPARIGRRSERPLRRERMRLFAFEGLRYSDRDAGALAAPPY